jgi:hypothetical protein
LFEVAFEEDWRAVVGEISLASKVQSVGGIVVLVLDWQKYYPSDPHRLKNCVGLFNKHPQGIWVGGIDITEEELRDLNQTKKRIEKQLRAWRFFPKNIRVERHVKHDKSQTR